MMIKVQLNKLNKKNWKLGNKFVANDDKLLCVNSSEILDNRYRQNFLIITF